MGDVEVRPARVDDAGQIGRVHVRSWQAAYRGLMPAAVLDGLDPVARADRHRERLERSEPGSATFVAVVDADVVGFASAGGYRDAPDQASDGEVYAIYVDPAAWNTGAGRALMDAAVGYLGATGPRPVRLWTLDGNERAMRFYERYGFTADGARGSHRVWNGVEVPTVRYTLEPR